MYTYTNQPEPLIDDHPIDKIEPLPDDEIHYDDIQALCEFLREMISYCLDSKNPEIKLACFGLILNLWNENEQKTLTQIGSFFNCSKQNINFEMRRAEEILPPLFRKSFKKSQRAREVYRKLNCDKNNKNYIEGGEQITTKNAIIRKIYSYIKTQSGTSEICNIDTESLQSIRVELKTIFDKFIKNIDTEIERKNK